MGFFTGLLLLILPACRGEVPANPQTTPLIPVVTQSANAAATPTITTPAADATAADQPGQPVQIRVCDCLPEALSAQLDLGGTVELTGAQAGADAELGPLMEAGSSKNILSRWIYVLVAPFPTVQDGARLAELKNTWQQSPGQADFISSLLVSESTYSLLTRLWGVADEAVVQTLPAADLLQTAWETENAWAIIPFEELDPRWKVMQIDGVSPLQSGFSAETYPLSVRFGLTPAGEEAEPVSAQMLAGISAPSTNLRADELTSVVMTGTTALVRYTALRMEENGVFYPARDIAKILLDADLTHISNEVSFWEDCPAARPVRVEARFCSDPSYFALLEYIDADVVELTGNHILDWGDEPFLETLQLYHSHDLPYFGGGADLTEASQPLTLRAKTQDFTFIGCSPAGPASVWAEKNSPGSNPCQPGWMEKAIRQALQAGAIPIITFQHLEVEDYTPHSSQRIDFQQAASQGAVIVSGSQSHFAQTMTFVGDHFVHYGLGNLFFDQMYGQNRNEFVDKHYFYQGKYISTELITLVLEDAAKPRLMNNTEREKFLQTIFDHCNWETVFQADTE